MNRFEKDLLIIKYIYIEALVYFLSKYIKSSYIVLSFKSALEPSAAPLFGSLTKNIKSETNMKPNGGVIRNAHRQLLKANAIFDPMI
jgi:hypothetical protein